MLQQVMAMPGNFHDIRVKRHRRRFTFNPAFGSEFLV